MLPHTGSSTLAEQQAGLQAAVALRPDRVRVTVHADSEVRSQALYAWLRARDWSAMLGIRGDTRSAGTPSGDPAPRADRAPRAAVVYRNGGYLTDAHGGPVQVIAWWAKDDDGKPIRRAVMTNLPATWRTYGHGRRRMWIETIVRDWQSQGCDRDGCGVIDPERFRRLWLALRLVYLGMVRIGRDVVKTGWRRRGDDGPPHAWKYSLFPIGMGWLEQLISRGKPLPVLFYLYG
ncbi:MAG: hypothetical protein MI924_04000 [Chloroflexales bacterium]|nr:hypothetical protein [Chloroflexales bacterium]